MTRAMGAGKPVVVFRHGSFMEPPAGSVAVPLDTFDTTGLSKCVADCTMRAVEKRLVAKQDHGLRLLHQR